VYGDQAYRGQPGSDLDQGLSDKAVVRPIKQAAQDAGLSRESRYAVSACDARLDAMTVSAPTLAI
jgi:hypothetical protein